MRTQILITLLAITSILSLFGHNSYPHNWAENTLANMSTDKKIGQLFMVTAVTDPELNPKWFSNPLVCVEPWYIQDLITRYHIGGIIFLGRGSVEEQNKYINQFQQLSSVPLLIGMDYESGLGSVKDNGIRFADAMTLGATGNPEFTYKIGKEIGTQCKATGVHINFGPVVDINNNPDNPVIGFRSFGEDKENVTRHALAYIKGLQEQGILACAKHFPGHGDTAVDSHLDLPILPFDMQRLCTTELYPFQAAIKAGVRSIMTAHLYVPAIDSDKAHPISLSSDAINGLLRKKMNFNGLVITDALIMRAVSDHDAPGQLELKALLAGNDILLCPTDVPRAVARIHHALKTGELSSTELDEHVLRILQAKEWAFNHCNWNFEVPDEYKQSIDNAYCTTLKKDAFQASVTAVNKIPTLQHNKPISIIQVGDPKDEDLIESLSHEFKCDVYRLSYDSTQEEIAHIATQIAPNTPIIIALFNMTRDPKTKFGISDAILDLTQKIVTNECILCIFGSPYCLKYFKKNSAALVAYQNDSIAQTVVAEIIARNYKAPGKLPVTIS